MNERRLLTNLTEDTDAAWEALRYYALRNGIPTLASMCEKLLDARNRDAEVKAIRARKHVIRLGLLHMRLEIDEVEWAWKGMGTGVRHLIPADLPSDADHIPAICGCNPFGHLDLYLEQSQARRGRSDGQWYDDRLCRLCFRMVVRRLGLMITEEQTRVMDVATAPPYTWSQES